MATKQPHKNPRETGIDSHALLPIWRTNIFKITSIVVVLIFVLIIAAGLIKEYYPSPWTRPTDSQILAAKTLVASALQSRGENASDYQVVTANRLRRIGTSEHPVRVLQVSASHNQTRHMYLVDINSNTIVMHSEIDIYSNMTVADTYNNYCEELSPCRLRDSNWR
jgi:hypothetical protein